MSDDLKALRALVKQRDIFGVCHFFPCAVGEDEHDDDCPVPSAEAALARLEAREAGRTQYDAFAEGFAKARELAANDCLAMADEVGGVGPSTLREQARRIRDMCPDCGEMDSLRDGWHACHKNK